MFRRECAQREHKCSSCLQYLMMAASPLYLNAHLDRRDEDGVQSPLVEGLFDDLLSARFGIVVQKKKCLSDAEVNDWFCDEADSEVAVQYANGKSLLLLLCRRNGIEVARELACFHNKLSIVKVGKPAVYASVNIVTAQRDVRLHFPEFTAANQASLNAVREYAISHLALPLVRELAALQLSEQNDQLEKQESQKQGSRKP